MEACYLVIGAGPTGLAMAKALKDAGMPYEQVEANDNVGGNWYHGTYDTANILSSRDVMEYPDFPMPDHYPDFPSKAQMLAYYQSYAMHFGLRHHIRFNRKAVLVTPIENNQWEVRFEDGAVKTYSGVLVCNGHHWSKKFPDFEGEFTGEVLHSKDYKSPEQLRGKRVLVVGAGNSAFDISSAAARVAKSCYMSVRRGIWIFPKLFMGKPLSKFRLALPRSVQQQLAKVMLRLAIGNPENYGFPKPTIGLFDRHPTVDSDTLINIKNGRIKVKGAIKRLEGAAVEFVDGSLVEVDTIVYATGFHVDFPFLPAALSRVDGNVVKVYGYSMYDDYKGLYILGWFQPRGGVGSLVTPYAALMVHFLRLQEKIDTPIGAVLKEMGEPLADTHLFGSVEVLNWIKKKTQQLKRIEKLGQKMDMRRGGFVNEKLETDTLVRAGEMRVY